MKKIFQIEVETPYEDFDSKQISGMLNVAKNAKCLNEYLKHIEILKVKELKEIEILK